MPTVLISAWVITYLDMIHSLLQKISPSANLQLINRTVLALHRSDQLQAPPCPMPQRQPEICVAPYSPLPSCAAGGAITIAEL